MSSDGRLAEGSRLAGAVRGWMLVVPPLGLVGLFALAVIDLARGGDLNRRIVSSPGFGQVGLAAVLTLQLTICGTLVRIARLPLPRRARINLMAWCFAFWAFAIPILEWTVMPESDGLPPGHSDDKPGDDPWENALRRFYRRCKWALGIYLVVALELLLAKTLLSAW